MIWLDVTLTLRMLSFRVPLARLACLITAGLSFSVLSSSQRFERTVPPSVEPHPFSTVAMRQTPLYRVEFRSADEISQGDRLLISNAESSIAEHAGFSGMEYQPAAWTYNQIVCPSFPSHLFLRYSRNNGAGDVSVFSASIPRNGEGRVRVVPILRRSYSLFSPAPINSLTIAAFNHIRAEEGEQANADWLGKTLCYAALAGADPRILPSEAEPSVREPVPSLTAMMTVELTSHGDELLRFDDAGALPHPMQWTMTFTRKGKLVKATRTRADLVTAKPAPQKSPVIHTRQVAAAGQP